MIEPANRDALPQPRRSGRWQFGLGPLLGTLMLLCIPFALWGAFFRANKADQFWLMMLVAAAPVGVTILLALSVSAGQLLRSRRRSRRPPDEEGWG